MELVSAALVFPTVVETTPDGLKKRHVLHRVGFDAYPASIADALVILQVAATGPEDYRNHRLHVHFQDDARQQIGDALDKMFILTQQQPRREIHVPYRGLGLARPGVYSFEVRIDGQHVKSFPLEATVGPPPARRQDAGAEDRP